MICLVILLHYPPTGIVLLPCEYHSPRIRMVEYVWPVRIFEWTGSLWSQVGDDWFATGATYNEYGISVAFFSGRHPSCCGSSTIGPGSSHRPEWGEGGGLQSQQRQFLKNWSSPSEFRYSEERDKEVKTMVG